MENNVTLRFFSSGGGIQSISALVLSAQGTIDFPTHVFCNVGDDTEHPDTLRYVREIAMPYAAASGIEFVELAPVYSGGKTLYQRLVTGNTPDIPMYLRDGPPASRSCTKHYKVERIAKEARERGATKNHPAIVGLGISLDEYQRMRNDNPEQYIRREYPLIDLRLSRARCIEIIQHAGLPIPPKSACWFCPFGSTRRWRDLKETHPQLFAQAIEIETSVNRKRAARGKDDMYLNSRRIPLEVAVSGTQHEMDFDDTCDSGFCMT